MRRILIGVVAAATLTLGLAGAPSASADSPTTIYRYENTFTDEVEPNPCVAGETVTFTYTLRSVNRVTSLPDGSYGASNQVSYTGTGTGSPSGANYVLSGSFTSHITQAPATESGTAKTRVQFISQPSGLSFGTSWVLVSNFDRTTNTFRFNVLRGSTDSVCLS